MAIEFEIEQSMKAPPERVFEVMSSPDCWGDWVPNLVFAMSGEATGMGWIGKLFGWLFKRTFVKALRKDLEAMRAYVEQR